MLLIKNIFICRCAATAVFLFAFFLSGCRGISIRPSEPAEELSRREVIARLSEQTRFFTSITDTKFSLRIVQEVDGKRERSPSVGGVLAFDSMLPGLWLRTERLGQNIFTLRAHQDSFWLELPDSREIITGSDRTYERMPQLARPEEILLWFAPPHWLGLTRDNTAMKTTEEEYVFLVTLKGLPLRSVNVDRRGLHINSVTTYDILGQVHTNVTMERHRTVNGAVFPHRIVIERPLEGYEITLRLGQPEFDRDFPEQAFLPRERPGWRHIDLDRTEPTTPKGLEGLGVE